VYPSQASWQETIPQLEKDPRWEHPALTLADKHDMFIAHLQSLAHKRLDALHKLFLAHAPSLDTPFEDVYPEIVNDFAVTRLGLTPEKLQSRYEEWQRVRFQQSKAEFQALLKESSFVDFWGRMKNKALAGQGVIPNEDSDEEDDAGDETGGKANLEMMAKQIDLKEMHDVLQVSPLLVARVAFDPSG
jgi:transcription elongation regulator 1